MKHLLTILILASSATATAADYSITKAASPGNIILAGGKGSATSSHHVYHNDLKSGTALKLKRLKGIQWTTTYYPGYRTERVQLCFFRPYASNASRCIPISPNANGFTPDFNQERFDKGIMIRIVHEVQNGPRTGRPAGPDKIVLQYSVD